MPTEPHALTIMEPETIAWHRVAFIQVKKYEVERRLEIQGGPITSFPLLGVDRRFAVEAVHRDDTWDRVMWTPDPVAAHVLANELAVQHGVEMRHAE